MNPTNLCSSKTILTRESTVTWSSLLRKNKYRFISVVLYHLVSDKVNLIKTRYTLSLQEVQEVQQNQVLLLVLSCPLLLMAQEVPEVLEYPV